MELPLAFATTASTVYIFYPYRDFVKFYPTKVDFGFATSRYRGLATHIDQWAILALPDTFMLGLGGRGDFPGIVVASALTGMMRRFLRTLSYRMAERVGARSGAYKSNWDAIATATSKHGVLSWFVGSSPAALVQFLTAGLALKSVAPRMRHRARNADATNFAWDWWHMFRAHAFFTTVSSPVRVAFSTANHNPTRGGDKVNVAAWLKSEVHIYQEAALVSKRMFQDMGVRYFFQGTLRTIMKVSVPFAFNFALFRFVTS